MKISNLTFGIVSVVLIVMVHHYSYSEKCMNTSFNVPLISSIHDVKKLFDYTPQTIATHTKKVIVQTKDAIAQIIAYPDAHKNWSNTIHALDCIVAYSQLSTALTVFSAIQYVHPDKEMRDAAQEAVQAMDHCMIDYISNNKQLYDAVKTYAATQALKENLSPERRYFLKELLDDFVRSGLELSDSERAILAEKKKALSDLTMQFDRAIADDQTKIMCTRAELEGLEESFIKGLWILDNQYVLGMDYPTVFTVLEFCKIEETRKKIKQAFDNRAYPHNEKTLQAIISLRHDIATMVGFESFADYDLADQMVGSAHAAEQFLDDLLSKAQKKVEKECALLKKNKGESVTLDKDGLIKPWDVAFITSEYKKSHYQLDERIIAEYFPMESTFNALLDIYRQFLSIDFVIEKATGLWHDDVQLVTVYTKDKATILGYLLLDLYPRAHKYSHAAHLGMIPALKKENGLTSPSVGLVMANFPQATHEIPALLKRSDVVTFFHEFGHALHYVLGATEIASQAGTHVKRDFVELPSQMLEEWLDEPAMLKKVSQHYKTKEPLSDEIITTIIDLKQLTSGLCVQRQIALSKVSLAYFSKDHPTNLHEVWAYINKTYTKGIAFDPESHFYCTFGHLTGYGAKYYGYLWSKVFALDLFDTIKTAGLLNPAMGKRYVDCILSQGGSKHPQELLEMFLERKPDNTAFLKSLGL